MAEAYIVGAVRTAGGRRGGRLAGWHPADVGRGAVLASRLPQSVPAVTVERQCGSSQQAIQFAAQLMCEGGIANVTIITRL